MKIGVLGGSFDPPHFGHMGMARQLLLNNLVDQIWPVPCFSHAFGKKMSPAVHRFEMTKLLGEGEIKVSSHEMSSKTQSYTIDTMNSLKQKYPQEDFFWIMGSDQLFVLETYKKWQEIIRNHNLIIYPREKDFKKICDFVDRLVDCVGVSQNIIILDPKEFKTVEISSTEIREKIKNNKDISKLVTKEVEEYIKTNKLYDE